VCDDLRKLIKKVGPLSHHSVHCCLF
jgi:hypothetical protein